MPILNIMALEIDGKKTSNTRVLFGGCTSVRISDRVIIDQNVQVNVGGPKVTFYLGEGFFDEEKFVVKGGNNTISINIDIPNGKLRVDGDTYGVTTMSGWFVAEKVVSEGKNVVWNNNNCTTPPVSTFAKGPETEVPVIGNDEVVDKLTVIASPNPSATEFALHIQSNDRETPLMIRITDVSGRMISVHAGVSPNTTVKEGLELKNGVYFAEVMQGKQKKVVKLIKL